ncbi:uncharacterized protein LOC131157421 isoform X2 [Malania oleifera]|uniref:uncharacterized protein LOC131157421 isoform X2 n=1 Tax=Malania oleifera TaxID=397392 RepID=UPI0025AEA32E|nr:uncharacterized protein LOC131157421 isoform X2 [Malania oleifera]
MDAVELPVPAAGSVAVPKLMGSEGFGRVGVTVKGVQAREAGAVSIVVSPAIDRCNSLSCQKDGVSTANTSESASWNKIVDAEFCRHAGQPSNFRGKAPSEELCCESTNNSLLSIPGPEVKQLQQKVGKVSRSSSGCTKRLRAALTEDSISQSGDDIFSKLGSYSTKCTIPDKTQAVKQKNNLNGKRGDKRNCKVPTKTKYDSYSPKTGLVSFNSAAGGNNFFGIYGLKSDVHDVAKHEDELSLNELLDGSYKIPSLGKDKGRKAVNSNENILQAVRKACSILQLQRPVRSQNFPETDNSFCRKMSTCLFSSGSCVATTVNSDEGDACCADPSTSDKIEDSCSKHKTPANKTNFLSNEPKDVLERLALPPPKDLESLLLDAAKPVVSSRNSIDLCLGKPISLRAGLPPFPWSHAFGGHCKSNSDAAKSSTNRNTCQGRWMKIGNAATAVGGVADCFSDLDSLTYDDGLVPSGLKLGPTGNEKTSFMSISLSWCEQGPSPSATCSKVSQVPLESGGSLKDQESAVHSPRLLAAAHTLYDIATRSSKQDAHGMIRWPKIPSQKAMKARKPKSNERPDEIFAMPQPVVRLDNLVEVANQIMPSKKPKLSATEKKKDLGLANIIRGPMNWSTPRSSRSSPNKSFKESFPEIKHFNANPKQPSIISPTTRVLDKACNSQQKLRKLVPMDWSRGRGRLD